MTPDDLTLNEAAEKLGVHYMTAYRYVRTGLLPGVKDGGTWLVTAEDLAQFSNRPVATPGRGHRDTDRQVEPLVAALTRGDERGAWKVIQSLQMAGCGVEELCTKLLVPAMAKIGSDWAIGNRSIADEHRATAIIPILLGRLRSAPLPAGRKRGLVVVGCPPNEDHGIPASMFSLLLERRRFEVDNLGSNTPPETFAEVAQTADNPVAIVFSVTIPENLGNLSKCLSAVRAVRPEIPLLAAGFATVHTTAEDLGVDSVITSFEEGLEIVASLVD